MSFILFSENQRKESTVCEEKLLKRKTINCGMKISPKPKKIASYLEKVAQKVASLKFRRKNAVKVAQLTTFSPHLATLHLTDK